MFAIIDPDSPSPPSMRSVTPCTLANELDEFLAVYNANKLTAIGWRTSILVNVHSLRNTCLRYLAFAGYTDVE